MVFPSTTIKDQADAYVEGLVPETGPWVVRPMRNASSELILPGSGVMFSGNAGDSVESVNVGTDLTAALFAGVAQYDPNLFADRDDGYKQYDIVPVVMFGPVVVKVTAAVSAGDVASLEVDDATEWEMGGGVPLQVAANIPLATYRSDIANGALGILDVIVYGQKAASA